MNHSGGTRLGVLIAILIVLALVALRMPELLLSHWAYAVQRAQLHADRDELARLQEASSAFRLVAAVARPGVVQIEVRGGDDKRTALDQVRQQLAEIQERLDYLQEQVEAGAELSREELRDLVRLPRRRQALEVQQDELIERLHPGAGSGILFDADGYVLTNHHVVDGRGTIRVRLYDQREFEARLIGGDRGTDLAVLKIDADNLHALPFGDSDRMEVGDWVLAVGAPFGLSQSVTHGIVSAKGRTNIATERRIIYQDFLQTDAAINPGNSGGPLLNLRGEVVGVNTAIATNGGPTNAGVAFTIPSNLALRIANQLKSSGQVARGWLGITMGDLTADDRPVLRLSPEDHRGVLVTSIFNDHPADRAGLEVEDVILSVDGRAVENLDQLRNLIADILPDQQVQLSVVRNGQPRDIQVTLGRRPDDSDRSLQRGGVREARELQPLGLLGRTLLPQFAPRYGFAREDRGVVIVAPIEGVEPQGGLAPRDLVVAVDEEPVKSVDELMRALQAGHSGQKRTLRVLHPGAEPRTVELR